MTRPSISGTRRLVLVASILGVAGLPVALITGSVLAAPQRDSQRSGKKETVSASFDDIKLEMKKDEPFKRELLTKRVKELVGKKIRIRGYMAPSSRQDGLKGFVLMRNTSCRFGTDQPFHFVLVELIKGDTTSYTLKPVTVEGVFEIREFKGPNGRHLAIYHMDARVVK